MTIYCEYDLLVNDDEFTDDGFALWKYIKPFEHSIITTCDYGNFDDERHYKKEIMNKLFPNSHHIITYLRHKMNYIEYPCDILIDTDQNILNAWEQNGGIAILHKNANDTIKILKSMDYL